MFSNIIRDAMKQEKVTVQGLAKKTGLSPTIIQELRTNKKKGITVKSFLKIIKALGYSFIIEKDSKRFQLEVPQN